MTADKPIHNESIYLGLLIRNKRHDLKLSQQQLASKIGISRVCIANIETAAQNPSFLLAIKICRYLQIDPNEFVHITDSDLKLARQRAEEKILSRINLMEKKLSKLRKRIKK